MIDYRPAATDAHATYRGVGTLTVFGLTLFLDQYQTQYRLTGSDAVRLFGCDEWDGVPVPGATDEEAATAARRLIAERVRECVPAT